MARRTNSRRGLVTVIVGVIIGMGLALAAEQIDRITSTDEFCAGSCHSMSAYIADEPSYLQSTHRTAPSGVVS